MRLKLSDWDVNYNQLIAFASKKTKKVYGTDFHLEMDDNPICSKEKFDSLMEINKVKQ